jgi:hypothetical protein
LGGAKDFVTAREAVRKELFSEYELDQKSLMVERIRPLDSLA